MPTQAEAIEKLTQTVEHYGAELLLQQQRNHEAIVSLTEALAGVRAEVDAAPEPEQSPTSADPEPEQAAPSLADLRELFAQKSREGHKDALRGLLQSYGAAKLPQVPEDKLAELAAKAGEL